MKWAPYRSAEVHAPRPEGCPEAETQTLGVASPKGVAHGGPSALAFTGAGGGGGRTPCSLLPRGASTGFTSHSPPCVVVSAAAPGRIARSTPQCSRGPGCRAVPGHSAVAQSQRVCVAPRPRPLLSLPRDSRLPPWVSSPRERDLRAASLLWVLHPRRPSRHPPDVKTAPGGAQLTAEKLSQAHSWRRGRRVPAASTCALAGRRQIVFAGASAHRPANTLRSPGASRRCKSAVGPAGATRYRVAVSIAFLCALTGFSCFRPRLSPAFWATPVMSEPLCMSEPEPCWPEGEEAPWALAGLNALSANRQLLTRTVDSASSSVAGRSRPSLCKCSGAGFRLSMTPSTQRRGREAEVTPARRGTAMAGLPCRLYQARVPSRRVERRPGCPSRRFVSVGPVGPCGKQFAVCTALGLGRSARGLPSPR